MGSFGRKQGNGSRYGQQKRKSGGSGGPKLPSSLLSQVDESYASNSKKQRRDRPQLDGHKRSKPNGHAGPSRPSKSPVRERYHGESEAGPSQFAKPLKPSTEKGNTQHRAGDKKKEKPAKKKKLPELTLPNQNTEDVEDAEIEWLEYMLKKDKGKGREDDLDDGLDDLLDLADTLGPGGQGLKRPTSGSLSEGDDDAMMSLESSEEEDDEVQDDDEESDVPDEGDGDDVDTTEPNTDEEITEPSGDEAGSESDENDTSTLPEALAEEEPSEPARYVPPQVRAAQLAAKAQASESNQEARVKLERQIQGLLNKLSEANIESILSGLEAIYRDHSRNSVTTAITNLIIQMISSRSNLLDSFVILYATLVGALHRVIGLEFGAHFTHTVVTRYRTASNSPSTGVSIQSTIYETPDASKESLNLLTLISELYNAGVIGSNLIYDLIRDLIKMESKEEVIGETEVEALLKVVRCCGRQLRAEDPASMKDIVGVIQDQVKGKESVMTTRAKFMLETLVNLKDGKAKSKKAPEGGQDSLERMNKYLSSLGRKRRLLSSGPLRASLQDLLNADKKGKWWLVGAGWSGNPLVEREAAKQSVKQTSRTTKVVKVDDDAALLEMARKQGMNTDVRRSVFVVLMTSEDYNHACDRLTQLRLTAVQQRECVRVTLHCASIEKTYNPYYSLILNQLCSESHDHRFTLQYAFWDFLRSVSNSSGVDIKRRSDNIAKTMAYLIARGNIDLTILKGVDWADLDIATTAFVVTLVIFLVIATHTVSPLFTLPKTFTVDTIAQDAVEDLFLRALTNSEVAQGLKILLSRELRPSKLQRWSDTLAMAHESESLLRSGLGIAIKTLKG